VVNRGDGPDGVAVEEELSAVSKYAGSAVTAASAAHVHRGYFALQKRQRAQPGIARHAESHDQEERLATVTVSVRCVSCTARRASRAISLATMYEGACTLRLADGSDEVHRFLIAKNVLGRSHAGESWDFGN
jgi:hypothetical protein